MSDDKKPQDPIAAAQRPYVQRLLEGARGDADVIEALHRQDTDLETAVNTTVREISIANGTMTASTAVAGVKPGTAIEAERALLNAKKQGLAATRRKLLSIAQTLEQGFAEVESLLSATNAALAALPKPKLPKAVIEEEPISAAWLTKGMTNGHATTDERNENLEGSADHE